MKIRKNNPTAEKIKMVFAYGITAFCIFFTCVMFSIAIYKCSIIYLKRHTIPFVQNIQHSALMVGYYKFMDKADKWWMDNIE